MSKYGYGITRRGQRALETLSDLTEMSQRVLEACSNGVLSPKEVTDTFPEVPEDVAELVLGMLEDEGMVERRYSNGKRRP